MSAIEWAVMLAGVLFYQFHDKFLDICEKFGPYKGMQEPPSGVGQDDHEMAFLQTVGRVPDVESSVQHPVGRVPDVEGHAPDVERSSHHPVAESTNANGSNTAR
ncbi:uncharacterized protein MYCFIDRAFT_211892 [Pseudocercospora fijiensis CIRAD86]|uniref:Uncharacterized protein n=1 Tax=Pseudocercospora fijiensis (strain CIRAD86) TaxID=383855 RepID=M3A5I4_PSEFD|nr:uncharacterized protein MYCFIDRAFT_211892 [Pseudocercospora fijiensis CIRAD86]EME79871.1 hypothetical protein MYCFIDRAFT_211892 [Pseudocercospora fijiensis CIRAD86]